MKKKELWLRCLTGFCIYAIAIGINRFSYSPAIPYLVNAHWLTLAKAGYVATANFLGYFLGAYITLKLVKLAKEHHIILISLLISVVSAFLCVINFGFVWLSVWRLLAGVMAGILMVVTPSMLLSSVSDHQKVIMSGIIFSGIGFGIAATSWLIPWFNHLGDVTGIWLGFAIFVLVLALTSFWAFSKLPKIAFKPAELLPPKMNAAQRKNFTLIAVGYALYGFGLVPNLVFLTDYAHRVLHASTAISSNLYALLGIGCAAGALVGGWLHRQCGSYKAVMIASIMGILSSLVVVLLPNLFAVVLSDFLSGFYLISMVVLSSSLVHHFFGMQQHKRYWAYLTLLYAFSQFLGGYVFSLLLSIHIHYLHLFWLGLIMIAGSAISYAFVRANKNQQTPCN